MRTAACATAISLLMAGSAHAQCNEVRCGSYPPSTGQPHPSCPPAFCGSPDELHEVQCCSDEDPGGWAECLVGGSIVYAERDLGFECTEAATLAQAIATCEGVGARLCTAEETEANCGAYTGCGHNFDMMWTSTGGGDGVVDVSPEVAQAAQEVTQEAEAALADAAAAVGPECVPGDPCSPLQAPGPNGVALVAPSLEAAITLDADIASIGAEGSATYTAFVETFEADMASILDVDVEQVEVTSVEAGSISCGFSVRPSGGNLVTPAALAASFEEPGVSLGGVQTSVALSVEDIGQQAAACNSPEILETVVNCTTFAVRHAVEVANFTIGLQEKISNAENADDVSTLAQELGASYFDMRGKFCNSTCATPLGPQWAMCNQGLYMVAQFQTALAPSASLLTALCGPLAVQPSPVAAVPAVGGTDVSDVPEEMQGNSARARLLRILAFALLLTFLIMAACFARWGPIPNRFSANSSSRTDSDKDSDVMDNVEDSG